MSPVPAQRDSSETGISVTTLSLLVDGQRQSLEGQRRLEDTVTQGFSAVHASIDRLRDETVHRREFDRYRDERTNEFAAAKLEHDKDIKSIREDVAANEARRVSRGRYVVTTLIALAAVLVTLTGIVLANLH